jgi:hypothetical protein
VALPAGEVKSGTSNLTIHNITVRAELVEALSYSSTERRKILRQAQDEPDGSPEANRYMPGD